MSDLELRNVVKRYGASRIIDSFSLLIKDGEFLVLVGPSGCGKSTLLRLIAGLAEPTEGQILVDGEEVTGHDPRQRNVAFVFQSYALYPHLTVRENIGFPLAMDRFRWWMELPVVSSIALRLVLRSRVLRTQVSAVAETLELTALLDRRPKDLSGGQRQRVALARSMVRDPELFLLDEPLSNLDAKLRQQMRIEISKLHDEVKRTFIYVTHDQIEAMTMASRVVVLDRGVVQQVGAPAEIYDHPANLFVARFIGSPPMNIFAANDMVSLSSWTDVVEAKQKASGIPIERLRVGIRPERISLDVNPTTGAELPVTVLTVEDHGSASVYGVELFGQIQSVSSGERRAVFPGGSAYIRFLDSDLYWFDQETTLAV